MRIVLVDALHRKFGAIKNLCGSGRGTLGSFTLCPRTAFCMTMFSNNVTMRIERVDAAVALLKWNLGLEVRLHNYTGRLSSCEVPPTHLNLSKCDW